MASVLLLVADRDRLVGDDSVRLGWQHRRGVQLENFQLLGHVVGGLVLPLKLANLVVPLLLLPVVLLVLLLFAVQLVQLLAGGRADTLQPLVVADRLAAQSVVLQFLRFLLLYHRLFLDCRLRVRVDLGGGRRDRRLQALLQLVAPLATVQVTFPYRYPLEGLAALEGRLVTVLLAADEPPQVLERQRPHRFGRSLSLSLSPLKPRRSFVSSSRRVSETFSSNIAISCVPRPEISLSPPTFHFSLSLESRKRIVLLVCGFRFDSTRVTLGTLTRVFLESPYELAPYE